MLPCYTIWCYRATLSGATVLHYLVLPCYTNYNHSLQSQCNSRCECSTRLFNPVCGTDNMTYFSPCYAGCQGKPIRSDLNTVQITTLSITVQITTLSITVQIIYTLYHFHQTFSNTNYVDLSTNRTIQSNVSTL